jgi:SAM-dependent methyltransferase
MAKDYLWPHLLELPYFRGTLRAVEARLLQQVDLPPPTLDVGSGDGHFASVAFSRPITVGIDPAAETMPEARRRGGYEMLAQANGARLPFGDGHFASALSNSVLEHVGDLGGVLKEVARVLKFGAPFAITVPGLGYRDHLSVPAVLDKVGLQAVGRAYEDWFMRMSATRNLMDERGWRQELRAAGFELEFSLRYFSPRALRMLEWGHYLGAPCLLARWLTGRWIIVQRKWNLALTEKYTRGYYREGSSEDGTYTFYLTRRRPPDDQDRS